MADETADDVGAQLDRHTAERRAERDADLARQDRADQMIAEALARRGGTGDQSRPDE